VELDPYGILKSLMPERVLKLSLRDKIDKKLDNVVFDFGGFDDLRLDQVAKQSDLVIIPFNPTLVSLGGTDLSTVFRTLFQYQILYLQIVTYYVQIQLGTYSPNMNAIVYGYTRFQ